MPRSTTGARLRGNTRMVCAYRCHVYGQAMDWRSNQAEVPAHTYVNLRVGIDAERYSVELWSGELLDDDSPVAGFRDVYFGNALPGGGAGGFFDTFFPWRITLSHPRGRQVGVTARFRF